MSEAHSSIEAAADAAAENGNFLRRHIEAYIGSGGTQGHIVNLKPFGGPERSPTLLLLLIVPLEILGQFMRLISLSVRLYANMLAGHMLILTFIGLIFVLENVFLAVIAVPAATIFYLFEVVIVVSIQAFIFAALSAIYIGSAIEPEH